MVGRRPVSARQQIQEYRRHGQHQDQRRHHEIAHFPVSPQESGCDDGGKGQGKQSLRGKRGNTTGSQQPSGPCRQPQAKQQPQAPRRKRPQQVACSHAEAETEQQFATVGKGARECR